MSEYGGFQVHGNYFEGNFRSVRKLFKKKKLKSRKPPSQSEILGKYNLTRSPLSSNYRLMVGKSNSAKALKSRVTNGRRI